MQLGEGGLVYRRQKAGIWPEATAREICFLEGMWEIPTRYRAVSDRREPEVSIKPVPRSLTCSADRAAGSGPVAARAGTQQLRMLTHPFKDIWKQKGLEFVRSPAPADVDRALCGGDILYPLV